MPRREWDEATLAKIRNVLRLSDVEDIKSKLLKYAEMYELFDASFPTWEVRNKVDWAVACALAPDWFGEALSTRINNTMLVSALLITVTTALLLAPPMYEIPNFDDDSDGQDSNLTKAFFYVCSVCNLLFIVSIILGIAFVENAMSRTYTEADKMLLIAKHYLVLNLCQVFSVVGSFLFVLSLLLPTFRVFDQTDATIMTIITTVIILVSLYYYVAMNMDSGASQYRQTHQFLLDLVDPSTGRLLPQYYPPDAEMSVSDFKAMFIDGSVVQANPRALAALDMEK